MKQEELLNEFKSFALNYFESYFNKRNLNDVLKMLDIELTGFGTGIDEVAYSNEEFPDLFARDINFIPDSIAYDIKKYCTRTLSTNIGLFQCELNIRGSIDGCEFSLNHLRQTLIMKRTNNNISITHLHISFPTIEHEKGESYPLKEIQNITDIVNTKVEQKTLTLMEAYKELEKAVIFDKLTNLYNRNKIDDIINQEIHRSKRYRKIFSIMFIDIDNFKHINDTYGHQVGDLIVKEFAMIISESFRNTDSDGRWGGDEFIIVLPESDKQCATDIAENMQKKVRSKVFSHDIKLTISIGICEYESNDSMCSIFTKVDNALYTAKKSGKNKIVQA